MKDINMRQEMKITCSLLLLLLPIGALKGQSISPPPISQPNDEVHIRKGVLDNGLTYYIKPIAEPQEKVSMYFIVKIGRIHEELNQANFAHHVEHLAFRPTINFPSGLVNNSALLTELGMSSQDINAFVREFETSYFFKPPNDNKKAIETGLNWFKEISSNLNLSEENINTERGALIQELSQGSSETFGKRKNLLYDYLFPCRSISKEPADLIAHIRQFPYQDLQSFHEKWYRPDLMVISIVGNIDDIDQLEEKIKLKFAEVKPSPLPTPKKECLQAYFSNDSSYLDAQPRFAVVSTNFNSPNRLDDDQISYHLIFRDHFITDKLDDFNDYKKQRSGTLLASILNKRLKESLLEYGNTFNFYSKYGFGEYPNSLQVIIGSKLKEKDIALNKGLSIINQFKTYGITAEEFEDLKQAELNRLQLIDTSGISYWEKQIRNHIIYHEWLASDKILKEIGWIKDLKLTDLNRRLRKLISGMPQDIGIIAPSDYQGELMSENSLRNIIKENFDRELEVYVPPISEVVLIKEDSLKALPLKPIEELKADIKGTQKIKLANGMIIILNPRNTSASSEEIYLHGFSNRGASSFPQEDYYSAMFAPSIIRYAGIGDLDKFTLDTFYEKHNLSYQLLPYLHLNEAGFRGHFNAEDLETVLQLIFMYFSKPRKDKISFKDWKKVYSKDFVAIPTNDLFDALNEATGDLTRLPYASRQLSGLKKVEVEKAFRIYKQIFGNAQDFTFIITGDITYDYVVPLLQKYLGNLPNISPKNFEPLPEPVEIPSGPVFRKFPVPNYYQGKNIFYGFKFIHKGVEDEVWQEEVKARVLGKVINQMFRDLRYKEGFPLYYTGIGGDYNRELERSEISFSIQSPPEEFDLIKERTLKFLDDIKTSKMPEAHIDFSLKSVENEYRQASLESPSRLSEKLYRFYRYEEPSVPIKNLLEYIEALTVDDIVQTAEKFFIDENFYEVLFGGEGD